MRKHLTFIIMILLLSCSFAQVSAQSSTELVIDIGAIPEVRPTRTSRTILSEQEHIADMARTEDGDIYILLVNLTAPQSFSIVKFESGQFSSRLISFNEILGGIEIIGDSLFFIEDGQFSENHSSYLIVEMDFQGNRLSELNVTIQNTAISPRLYIGKDGSLYLWGMDVITMNTKLVKIGDDGNVAWTKVIGTGILSWGDVQVLPNGMIYILNVEGLALRNSNGDSLWNRTLSSNINWVPKTLHTFEDDSVCVLASYVTGYVITGGTIYRYDIDGNLLGNKTFVPSEMIADEEVHVGDLEVYGNSMHSVVYYSNNRYLLEISKDFNNVKRSSTDVSGSIQFTQDGSIVLITENTSRYERHLVAYVFANNQFVIVLMIGGSAAGLIVLALIWRRKQDL